MKFYNRDQGVGTRHICSTTSHFLHYLFQGPPVWARCALQLFPAMPFYQQFCDTSLETDTFPHARKKGL
ncbi:hypothetical protein NQ314_016874 [Rhamnusium bicolor]|uniref:Uncharacterized protein n=1 Tax=Rhamnusium bicolor TaxID=1586634 RepID=A0AAV8WUS8_9CUCU|nr:hypothetical protein NQ314_016874 [Rhamnusium bicolor]